MLVRTYRSIIQLFKEHQGYMCFSELHQRQVSTIQLRELEEDGVLQRFSRGWYWCNECGFEKPHDYKYIEITKVNPRTIICMESASYLNKLLKKEPDIISFATDRQDRTKMDLIFPTRRYFLQNTNISGEFIIKQTPFGNYRYYSPDRTVCDIMRMKSSVQIDTYIEITNTYKQKSQQLEHIMAYAKALRALSTVKESF